MSRYRLQVGEVIDEEPLTVESYLLEVEEEEGDLTIKYDGDEYRFEEATVNDITEFGYYAVKPGHVFDGVEDMEIQDALIESGENTRFLIDTVLEVS